MDTKARHIFIGDIHACATELLELLKLVEYDQSTDMVVLTGDLLGRGPSPIETIRKIQELKLLSVLGNHDLRLGIHIRGSSKPEKRPAYLDQLTDEDKRFILTLPPYMEFEDVICIHAGMKSCIPLQRQGTDLQYLRYTNLNRKFISLRDISKYGIEKLSAHFWTEFGPFGKSVVYGHQVHSMTDIRIDRFTDGTACYGIDNGAVFGGKLSALIWETKEVCQVQAHEVYFQPSF